MQRCPLWRPLVYKGATESSFLLVLHSLTFFKGALTDDHVNLTTSTWVLLPLLCYHLISCGSSRVNCVALKYHLKYKL